jgi:hypothetical protein
LLGARYGKCSLKEARSLGSRQRRWQADGKAKVNQTNRATTVIADDVRRIEVPMDDVMTMNVRKCNGDLAGDADGLDDIAEAGFADEVREWDVFDVLQNQCDIASFLDKIQ